jgi:serine/threonine-protein kinase RsbW
VAALPNFQITASRSGSGTTIKLAGELDSASCAELLERFEEQAQAPGLDRVVLDLAEVSFIDSAGMRAIILIERSTGERGLGLSITPPPVAVTELLQLTGIADHVTLSPQADQAPPDRPFIDRIELELTRDPHAPGRARAELRGMLRGRLVDADADATLTLLTSELVTNAVIHPGPGVGGSIDLRITTYADQVRVEVGDAGSGFELDDLPPRPRESGGHGLIVVEGLSSRWGTRRRTAAEGDGFCVWFELDVDYRPEAAVEAPGPAEQSVAAEG